MSRQFQLYKGAREIFWCQEEPQNQGAWFSIQDALRTCLTTGQDLHYAGRIPMAAPAGGDHHKHLERQKKLVDTALAAGSAEPRGNALQPQLVTPGAPAKAGGGAS